MLVEQLFDGAGGALANKAVQMALDGDSAALRLCVGRIIAPRRHRPTAFTLPALNTAADGAAALSALAAAVSEGALSSAEAAELSQVVDSFDPRARSGRDRGPPAAAGKRQWHHRGIGGCNAGSRR